MPECKVCGFDPCCKKYCCASKVSGPIEGVAPTQTPEPCKMTMEEIWTTLPFEEANRHPDCVLDAAMSYGWSEAEIKPHLNDLIPLCSVDKRGSDWLHVLLVTFVAKNEFWRSKVTTPDALVRFLSSNKPNSLANQYAEWGEELLRFPLAEADIA